MRICRAGKTFLTACLFLCLFVLTAGASNKKLHTVYDSPTTLTYPSFWHTPFGVNRGTAFWLKVFLGNKTFFSNPQDVDVTKLKVDYGKINEGKDDWQLNAYGINSGRSEIIYNVSMHSLNVYGGQGSGDGEFMFPIGIACNKNGDIYVADTGNHRIVRLFDTGKEMKFIRNLGNKGNEKGNFVGPRYVDIDSAGNLYVSDTGNNRIQIFSRSGGFLRQIGPDKGVSNPQGICVVDKNEMYNGYKQDYIYLIDGNNDRIQKFDFKGNLVRSVRIDEVLGRRVYLTTLDMDYFGNVYVVDNMNSKIYKFSPDLDFITDFGSYGTKEYQFERPTGIAIYKHYGQVVVSDRESAQYFWIGSDVKDFRVSKIETGIVDALQYDFFLTEKSFITIEIEAGNEIIKVCEKLALEAGKNSISWQVPAEYFLRFIKGKEYNTNIRVMATYSSYPHIEKVVFAAVHF